MVIVPTFFMREHRPTAVRDGTALFTRWACR
jgi:hypothetical protein